ncbi:TrmH family RNA methyltransferase [Terrilactibacillus laevilacticus]|uniref:TrmH family RNA methyltransferase n=1 Tax=Terrilactibacillus laevilacticus TaxID=1380157 RepID=A0ABW5PT46_9BACI|nr:RNA methyltransferase [Terrilactibacillus laevilacticus]
MKKIESMQNQTYKEWKKLHKRKGRDKAHKYLIEGPHLVQEALQSSHEIEAIIYDVSYGKSEEWKSLGIDEYRLTHELFDQIAQTETSQGVIAVCKMFNEKVDLKKGRYLLVDRVQDPGNLGTMIRTADACGLDAVILGKGTVDQFNDKTLRSAQGSHFHLPVISNDLVQTINHLQELKVPVYATSLDGVNLQAQATMESSFAVIVGNEGNGVTDDIQQQADFKVKIPMFGQAESLNVAVATGIILYWFRMKGLAK